MLEIIERILKLVSKYNCVSNTSKIEEHGNKIKELLNDLDKMRDNIDNVRFIIEAKLEHYYDKDHMTEVIQSLRRRVHANEDQILTNHNLLYEKNQEISDKLHSEVQKNSIGLAEIKGLLVRKSSPSWK